MVLFWASALAVTILLYVLLDGFDLGVGILFGLTRDPLARNQMMGAIAPVWDGNETWLVVTGAVLFGAFPRVYAVLLSSFYLPMIVMLLALILRGVAFEFRAKAKQSRRMWDLGFVGGSAVAAFVQGVTLGALVEGLPLRDGQYTGGMLGWFTPFSCLCGFGLCSGYALLGAGWLAGKCEGRVRERALAMLPALTAATVALLGLATVFALVSHLRILERWWERPYLTIFPLIGASAAARLMAASRKPRSFEPFLLGTLLFVAAFGALAISFWPYIVPFSITVEEAASPASSLGFMFWGAGVVVLPLTILYTVVVYSLFRGRVTDAYEP
jgi:cytochrome d ubiquinol oxidase subunit II